MKILFITMAFAPTEFSESLVNSKLVLAFKKAGYQVDVISRSNQGVAYSTTWNEPWLSLKTNTHEIEYKLGNKMERLLDTFICSVKLKYPLEGVRWASRAYDYAKKLIESNKYDVIMTRSPSDIAHLVGLKLKKEFNIKWIANWNDPSTGIWPIPYEDKLPLWKKIIGKKFTQEVLSKVDFNTFPSQLLVDHFKQFYHIDKYQIIPHIMLSDYQNEVNDKNPASLHICHSGNLSIERDPENLFIAIKKFISLKKKEIYLDVLGVATPYALGLVETYDLHKFVIFVKPLPYYLTLKKIEQYDVLMIIEAKMGKSIFLPSKITDYVQLKKPILSISPSLSEVGNLLNMNKGGIVANNASVDDIYEKLCILDDLKFKNKLDELIKNTTLNKYLGIDNVLLMYDEIFTFR